LTFGGLWRGRHVEAGLDPLEHGVVDATDDLKRSPPWTTRWPTAWMSSRLASTPELSRHSQSTTFSTAILCSRTSADSFTGGRPAASI
jgi:hypothetical protein